jgi:hypothetical protein
VTALVSQQADEVEILLAADYITVRVIYICRTCGRRLADVVDYDIVDDEGNEWQTGGVFRAAYFDPELKRMARQYERSGPVDSTQVVMLESLRTAHYVPSKLPLWCGKCRTSGNVGRAATLAELRQARNSDEIRKVHVRIHKKAN